MTLRPPVFIAMLLAAAPMWAHHGSTGFDQKKPVHFTGQVSLLDWSNPHIVIHLEVAGADGNLATWLVHHSSERGDKARFFEVGTEISVDGFEALDGSGRLVTSPTTAKAAPSSSCEP